MQLARVAHAEGVSFALLEDIVYRPQPESVTLVDPWDYSKATAREIAEHPFGEPTFTGKEWQLADVRLLAPILATKIISLTSAKRELPSFVFKPNTSIAGPTARIARPAGASEVYAGPTLAVIIGQPGRKLTEVAAERAILGYTLAADVTSLTFASEDGDFTRAKSYDGFLPLGPWIDTAYDPTDLRIEEVSGGALSQHLELGDLVLEPAEAVAALSHIMTLLPGDTILLGTKYVGAPIVDDTEIVVRSSGLGELRLQMAPA